eukprot:jgi/Psemu1/44330/gm1.44330_g
MESLHLTVHLCLIYVIASKQNNIRGSQHHQLTFNGSQLVLQGGKLGTVLIIYNGSNGNNGIQ